MKLTNEFIPLPIGTEVKLLSQFKKLYLNTSRVRLPFETSEKQVIRLREQDEDNEKYNGVLTVAEHKNSDLGDRRAEVFYFHQIPDQPHLAHHFEAIKSAPGLDTTPIIVEINESHFGVIQDESIDIHDSDEDFINPDFPFD